MLNRIYDLQTISENDTVEHHTILTENKHTAEYQALKKSLKGYIKTVDISPSKNEIEKELSTKKVDKKIKDYILNQF